MVNDGSEDNTEKVAKLSGATVISLPQNSGKAAALHTGFEYAIQNRFRFTVMLDADGQNNPNEIPIILQPLLDGNADFVLGSRFLKKEREIPLYRQMGQKVLNHATNLSSSKTFSDTQSGFRGMNLMALELMEMVNSNGYGIESAMLNQASEANLRVMEVPISVKYDVPNGHKKNFLTHGVSLLGNIINSLAYRRPLFFFGNSGMAFLLIGSLLMLGNLMGVDLFFMQGTWILWSIVMIVSGVIIMMVALMLNAQVILKSELIELHREIQKMREEL